MIDRETAIVLLVIGIVLLAAVDRLRYWSVT